MIAIIDYGMGNLRSVQKGFERVGADARIVTSADEIERASKVVLPGVGAFADAIEHMRTQGLIEPVRRAIDSGRPFLGICLGLQLLFDVSYEDGEHTGLGSVPGKVVRFDFSSIPAAAGLKVPHMGWNQLRWDEPCPILAGLDPGTYFYFVHSYYVQPIEADVRTARCDYGIEFVAMIWRDNLFATQFHPEKSQKHGLRVLENFSKL
ncbi:MAG: imidazole glycerol phosphate synthase subunit HisH [Phycisphaerae bacterium]|nr:imidazole glycerol phosphate synthase subunit HisH [Phycisphaerae bacterium]